MSNGRNKNNGEKWKFKITEWRGYMMRALEEHDMHFLEMDSKLDTLLEKGLITEEKLASAIATHTENCTKGNPNGKDVLRENWQVLLVMGTALASAVAIIGKLIDFII